MANIEFYYYAMIIFWIVLDLAEIKLAHLV